MTYLPLYLNTNNLKVLIIGGGNVAYQKLKYTLDFTNNIQLISIDFSQEIKNCITQNSLKFEQKEFSPSDIIDYDLVIVAINNIALQKSIHQKSKNYPNTKFNYVDLPYLSDFIFPSYIKEDKLTITISTNGISPAFSKQFKNYIKTQIPNDIGRFLNEMSKLRQTLPKGEKRMKLLKEKVNEYMKKFK